MRPSFLEKTLCCVFHPIALPRSLHLLQRSSIQARHFSLQILKIYLAITLGTIVLNVN